ncbi:MAG: DUF4421 family protein [Vicingaceae bacterium]
MKLHFLFLVFVGSQAFSQEVVKNRYFENYPAMLTTRLYEVTKFNSFQILTSDESEVITYRPNTNVNMGFGFTYRGLSLNLGFKIPAFNDDSEEFGKTEHFNADAGLYLKKVAGLAFFQFYNGYYISDLNTVRPDNGRGNGLLIRPDVKFFSVGVSGEYIVNYNKFSYRAAFTQDAWQKKSAGSFLIGGYAIYSGSSGDSNLIPTSESARFDSLNLREVVSFDVGPMVGYVYTLVINQHWFSTASLSLGRGLNFLEVYDGVALSRELNVNFRVNFRFALGYNGPRNYFGLSYYNEGNQFQPSDLLGKFNTGQFRINLVHRFNVNSLGFIDKFMDKFHWFFLDRLDLE